MSGSTLSVFEQINGGILGLCKPRTESTPFTVYPIVEPVIFLDTTSGGIISPTDEQGKLMAAKKLRFKSLSLTECNVYTYCSEQLRSHFFDDIIS